MGALNYKGYFEQSYSIVDPLLKKNHLIWWSFLSLYIC